MLVEFWISKKGARQNGSGQRRGDLTSGGRECQEIAIKQADGFHFATPFLPTLMNSRSVQPNRNPSRADAICSAASDSNKISHRKHHRTRPCQKRKSGAPTLVVGAFWLQVFLSIFLTSSFSTDTVIEVHCLATPSDLIIRCPYCRLGNEFRLMITPAEGWLFCEGCGHNAMPQDPDFKCTCLKCKHSQSHIFIDGVTDPHYRSGPG